jgi:hypothetical protein
MRDQPREAAALFYFRAFGCGPSLATGAKEAETKMW